MELSRDEKLRKIDALREKKRRILAKKPVYKPNPGQLPVHLDQRDIRVVQSGNGSGKSTLAVNEVLWWARGVNPVLNKVTRIPARIAVVLDKPDKVEDIWLTEMRKWTSLNDEAELFKNGKPYVEEIKFKNGSVIQFFFHDQAELTVEGIQVHYVVFDEPPPRHLFVGLTRGTREKGTDPKILIIGTPIKQPWVYELLYKPAEKGERTDIGVYRFSSEVNRANLREGWIESFTRNLTEKEKQARIQGIPAHLEGLALAHLFKPELHIVPRFEWPSGKPVVVVIDPHPAKAHVAIMVGATGDNRVYYIKEMSSLAPPKAFARELKAFYQGYRVLDIVCDSLGETPGSGGDGNLSFSEVLRAAGIPARSTSFKEKSDEDFIQRIRQVLEIPETPDNFGRILPVLAIMEGNPGIVNDVECVSWVKYKQSEDNKPKLDISNRDRLACLKYALATNIGFIASIGRAPKLKRAKRSPWSGRSAI